jgi:hypothetical protein
MPKFLFPHSLGSTSPKMSLAPKPPLHGTETSTPFPGLKNFLPSPVHNPLHSFQGSKILQHPPANLPLPPFFCQYIRRTMRRRESHPFAETQNRLPLLSSPFPGVPESPSSCSLQDFLFFVTFLPVLSAGFPQTHDPYPKWHLLSRSPFLLPRISPGPADICPAGLFCNSFVPPYCMDSRPSSSRSSLDPFSTFHRHLQAYPTS